MKKLLPIAALCTLGLTSAAAADHRNPRVQFSVHPNPAQTNQNVTLDASASRCYGTGGWRASNCRSYVWQDDADPNAPLDSPWPLGTGKILMRTFSDVGTKYVWLTVTDGAKRQTQSSTNLVVNAALPPLAQCSDGLDNDGDGKVDVFDPGCSSATDDSESPDPTDPSTPPATGGCEPGATNAATAAAVRSAVQANQDVCVTANVGNVNLTGLTSSTVRYVGTTGGGQMGLVDLSNSSRITLRARFRSTTLRSSNLITIEQSVIGGTSSSRVLDQLIYIPCCSDDVTVRDSDIGWTNADSSGNTGYGFRVHGGSGCCSDRLRIERNKIHDIAADGIQGLGTGTDVLIDRNEIGPVGANPGSNEHSDNIQIIDNGPNLRITNNWIHHQGYYNGNVTGNAGSTYIHGGSTGSLRYLIQVARGRTEICGLGTGGTSRSNITIRRNTWVDGGQAYSGFPGFEWDCDSGTGNTIERNIAVDPDGGFAQAGSLSGVNFNNNLFGQPSLVTFDAQGNATSSIANPSGQDAIGYRKPSGVHW
jgi:hypothetical protein